MSNTSTNYLATPNDETRMTRKRLQVSRRKIATTNLGAHCSTILYHLASSTHSIYPDRQLDLVWIARTWRKRKPFYCFRKRPIARAWHSVLLYFVFLDGQQHTSRFLPFLHIRLSFSNRLLLERKRRVSWARLRGKDKEKAVGAAPMGKEKKEISNIVGALKWMAFFFFLHYPFFLSSLSLSLSLSLSASLTRC